MTTRILVGVIAVILAFLAITFVAASMIRPAMANAHVHQAGPSVFWQSTSVDSIYSWDGNRPCGVGSSLIADGNQNKGFMRATTSSRQRDIAFGSDCVLQLKKQAGQIKAKAYYYVHRDSGWAYCDATPLVYNGSANYTTTVYYDYSNRPCGRAYYRVIGFHRVWGKGSGGNHAWHDGFTGPTDKHWFG